MSKAPITHSMGVAFTQGIASCTECLAMRNFCDECLYHETAPRGPLDIGTQTFCRVFQVDIETSRRRCRGRKYESFDDHFGLRR